MRERASSGPNGRTARSTLIFGSCALPIALLLAGAGSAAKVRMSEDSHAEAYGAGLGFQHQRLDLVRAPGSVSAAYSSCAAAAARLGSARIAYAALVKQTAVIRTSPQGRSREIGRFGRFNQNGFRAVLGVIGKHTSSRCTTDWYRVQLPVLPNGKTGWVRAWAVQPFRVRSRITVDLSQRRLRVYRSGKVVVDTRVAVGTSATPTPPGHYFVNERYVLRDASGPFGPSALGISAHSDVLQHVWVEDGPIGIHGTNEPWSIGRAASHGCIRVSNNEMRRIFRLAPAGTPVIVA
jgi:lipoprotein-anchoring transpeptidase ErfK/SrfK